MTASDLKDALVQRGTSLNEGFPRNSALVSTMFFQRRLPEALVRSHLLFDGFVAPDRHSQINMWSIEKIISETNQILPPESTDVIIGDFLMNSEFYVYSPKYSIRSLYENVVVARSYDEFWSKFLDGNFDIAEASA